MPAQRRRSTSAGAALAASTAALCAAVRDEAPDAECLLLVYLPTLLDASGDQAGERAAGLGGAGLRPAPARGLRLGDRGARRGGRARGRRDGGPARLSGRGAALFRGLRACRRGPPAMDSNRGGGRGARQGAEPPRRSSGRCRRCFATASSISQKERATWRRSTTCAFRSALGREVSVEPAFSTAIVTTAGGAEQRNADWADARLSFDAGPRPARRGRPARTARLLPRAAGRGGRHSGSRTRSTTARTG